eukprot:TRINITY_DN2776_c0_g1_i1.p1 TRINITY_DN2776_c0_g1~~TRINITY_DN2776_c0_g1_i1.p1  ORF type:complete len:666 (-),score=227.53 TRINITY_DN2776_c0_g1_i1:202-2058(-)
MVESEDLLKDRTQLHFQGRSDMYREGIQKQRAILKLRSKLEFRDQMDEYIFDQEVGENSPWGVHSLMFAPSIRGQGDAEQVKTWLPKALNYEIIGTYAQTELGHGTFLRGLETTATFDQSKDAFILDSPTLTSTKWWPGGLGKSSNFVVLMARLILNGEDKGPHAFLLQIRDLETHEPLPGITVGDIGPKMAYETVDNGFLRLNKVEIPRRQMLMKYAQVSKDGVYTNPPHSKVTYGTMVYVRVGIVLAASRSVGKAITIAIRYSAVRRQGLLMHPDVEEFVIDYQLQQQRLFGILASTYALHFSGLSLGRMYLQLLSEMADGDFNGLPELHATSSGLKAFATWISSEGIEEARKCCGGHGYSKFSGISAIYAENVPACTYEGENNVLIQQTARYLFKISRKIRQKEFVPIGNASYLIDMKLTPVKCQVKNSQEFLQPEVQLAVFRHRAVRIIAEISAKFEELKKLTSFGQAWNTVMVDLVRVARGHCYYVLLISFIEGVSFIDDEKISAVLKNLCDLFFLNAVESQLGDFLEDSYFNQDQVAMVRSEARKCLQKIRPEAVALVDAWNFSDRTLNSALGRYDGKVYETMLEWAQKDPLNETQVVEGYLDILKSFRSKL